MANDIKKSQDQGAEDQAKVLNLQDLEESNEASGGAMAWSTDSIQCGGVTTNEWSTISRGCRTIQAADQL